MNSIYLGVNACYLCDTLPRDLEGKELNRNATGRVMGGRALAFDHSGGLAWRNAKAEVVPSRLTYYPFRSVANVSDSYYKSPEFDSQEGKEVLIELNNNDNV